MTKLFIFDMGGVLVRRFDILPSIASLMGLELESLVSNISDDLIPLMEGKLSSFDFWKRFTHKSGIIPPEKMNLMIDLYEPFLDGNTEKLIRRIKRFCPVVCGTNTISEHYEYHLKKGDYQVFDTVYASHLMGVAKPKPAFYQWILDREKVNPEEVVFADDLPENIEAARTLGIHSFLFTEADVFEKDLARAGIEYS
ncbi:HAD family phosphatase [Oceanispirochaeta crateris]|uniref:HAD family phosphatase n=1 Tax=Oceanispirochaeta crateris TaxID=2518645 RepID=A0A5C1QM80_9SPIO|nr:HAD-IA family hydrolase [Oceanispirochaeta crateris]QEN08080.1 HAD family phosphatase [Oceanispirochaeta crateris]